MADTEVDVEDSDLGAIIARELNNSQTFDQTELSQKRAAAIAYMKGDMTADLPARVNGSSQTSRDVSDTISWILPGVVRVFTASDQMVMYTQVQEEDDRWAEEATEYTNYSFMTESDGYRILYNTTYDALLMGNGVVTSYWEPPQTETRIFRNKVPEELVQLITEDGWHPISQKEGTPRSVSIDDPASEDGKPQEIQMPTYTVKMGKTKKRGRICDDTLKPENLYLNAMATTIDDARFRAYLHDDKTRSDLVEMAKTYGWDLSDIDELPSHNLVGNNAVSDARFSDVALNTRSTVRSGDPIQLWEVYIQADKDGDGIAETLQVWYAGPAGSGKVLGWDEWEDEIPYTDVPCYPVPHRWDAESVFDRTADIQRVKTMLLRQGLDNMYAVNQPMREVETGSVENPDILVNPKFGGLIWKKKGSAPILPHVVPFIADKAFMGLEYMDAMITKRTGVSKVTMALDPEALQNQTATANQNLHDAGYSQIELIARNMAELGWKPFFKKRLKLAQKYEQVRKIPSNNGDPKQPQGADMTAQPGQTSKFREIQPSNWDPEMAVSINVGLGTGSRDRDMSMLKVVKDDQMMMASQLSQAGFGAKAVEFIPKIRQTAIRMAESAGLKNPDDYYPEISDDEVEQMKQQASQGPQPDPRIAADLQHTQLKIQGEQASQQSDAQIATIKAQAETTKAQLEGQVSALKLQMAQKEAQEQDQIAGLQLQLQEALAANKNDTDLKKAALASLTSIEVARIGAKADVDSSVVSAYLESIVGIQQHSQNVELKQMEIDAAQQAQAAKPQPNGAAQ